MFKKNQSWLPILEEKAPKLKALLVDCDGTLADTMPAHDKAYELAFALNDVPFDRELHQAAAQYGGEILMKTTVIDKGYSKEVADQIVSDKQKLLGVCLDKKMVINKELIDFIKRNEHGLYIIVVSNGRAKSINQILEKLNIFYHVSDRITKECYNQPKPSPQPYLLAMQKFGLNPDEVFVLEDNHIGYSSAVDAGIKNVYYVETE